jgi:hypothetical protein
MTSRFKAVVAKNMQAIRVSTEARIVEELEKRGPESKGKEEEDGGSVGGKDASAVFSSYAGCTAPFRKN